MGQIICYFQRPLIRHYYPGTDALIFVVDSGDRERLSYVTEELHNILREYELEGVPVAIMANKQDLANCMTVEEISKALQISDEQKRRGRKINLSKRNHSCWFFVLFCWGGRGFWLVCFSLNVSYLD